MREAVISALACALLAWAAYMLWNGSHFLFMLPMGAAILLAEGLDDGDSGDCDPCMGER